MFDINDMAISALEPIMSTPLQRAQKDGYINITGVESKRKIEYITSEKHVENYEDPEEKVRAEFFAELIYKYEYPANRIKVEVVVPDRLPTDRADIVVFSDDDCKRPYAIVECKKEGVTDAEFNQAIEQGVGNATWVKLRADYVVIIAGGTRRVLDISDKYGAFEREQNILADLPRAYGKPQEFRFYKGTDNDIKPVSREDLIAAIKKCHQTLWGGGRLSPPTAFGELCKLIFVKISDEQDMARFLNAGEYKFFPEVILATNLTDGTKDFDEIGLFHESLQSGQTWNKSIGNFQFNILRHASKNVLNQYDKLPGIERIYLAHIKFDETVCDLTRIDGNHRLSAADEVTTDFSLPFCLLLFRNPSENDQFTRAIFHNINAKQIPLKLEENLKVILESPQVFSDDTLVQDPSFGWKYYLARKTLQNLDFTYFPAINS